MPGPEIDLPALVTSLRVDLSGLTGAVGDGSRRGSAIGAAIGDSVRGRLEDSLRALPDVQIDADSSQADRDLDALRTRLRALSEQRIGVDIDTAAALRQADEIRINLDRLAQTHPDIQVRADIAGALGELDVLRASARRLDDERPTIRPQVDRGAVADVELDLSKLGETLGSLGKVAALGSLVPQLGAAVAGLAQLAPAAGVAASGVLAVGSALAVVKLGTAGLSDALGGDTKALDKLAPSARNFVGAVKAVTPEFDRVRTAIQQSLFADLGPTLERLARTTLPSVRAGLTTTATSLNAMGRSTATALDQLAKTGTLRTALTGVGRDLGSLQKIPGQLITGLVQIGAAAEPVFGKLTSALGGAATTVTDKISAAFKSGALQKAISGAAGLIGQLVGALANVGRAVANIFGPALQGGGAFISTFSTIAKVLADITGSQAAQQALQGLFGVLRSVSGLISGTLNVGLRSLIPVAEQLITALSGPLQQVIGALGPILAQVIGALTRALGPVVAALGPALRTIAPVITQLAGSLATALTPVLGVVGELLTDLLPPIAQIVAQVGRALGPVLVQVGQILAQVGGLLLNLLTPVLKVLPGLIGPIVTIAGTLLTAFAGIAAQLLGALGPALSSLGKSLAKLAIAVTPLLTVLAQLIARGLVAMMPILTPLIALIGRLATILASGLARYITSVVVPAVKTLSDLLSGHFSKAAGDAQTAVSGMIKFALNLLTNFPSKAGAALAPLAEKLGTAALRAGERLTSAINTKVGDFLTVVRGLPGRAASALGSLGGKLYNAGASLISGFISGIKSEISKVESTLGNLTDKLTDWKGPPKKDATLLTPAGKLLIKGLVDGIDAATPSLKSKLNTLTNDIERAISINAGNRRKVSGLTPLLHQVESDNKKLLSLASQRDSVAKQLKAATDKLASLQAASAKVASNISSGILSDANITQNSGDGVLTLAGIFQQLSTNAAQATQFASQIAQLKKAGLSPELLQELADAGVAGGGAAAKALAGATPLEIKAINAMQANVDRAAKSTGSTVANSLYGTGIQAAKGIVAGLKSQEGAIEKEMEKIAAAMTKAIKKALKIKSPSRVMAEVGGFTGDGVVVGLRDRFGAIRDAATQAGQLVAQAAQGAAAALGGVPSAGQLRPLVAGSAPTPYQPVNHFYLSGGDATPAGISRQLAWDAKVGRR